MSARRLAAVLAIVITVGGADAYGGDRELARQRYLTGTVLYQRGRYADALVELERGKQADPKPEFDYNIGLCLQKLGRASEAADAYERFLAVRPQDREAEMLRAEIARLRASAAVVSVPSAVAAPTPPAGGAPAAPNVVAPPPATSLAPPPATWTAPSAAVQPYGAPTSGVDAFASAARPPSFVRSTRGQAALAVAAVGGAALLTAAITGGVALSDRDSYRAGCAAGRCDDTRYDDGRRLAIGTDVLLGIGAAAAVTATIVAVTWRTEHRTVVAPSASANGAGITLAGGF